MWDNRLGIYAVRRRRDGTWLSYSPPVEFRMSAN